MDRNSAQAFGFDVVDNSSAASFKLRSTKKQAKKSYSPINPFNQGKFRQKTEGDDIVHIEKRGSRIDTKGEINGISAKGWAANRLKKMSIRGFI